jgi:hypothetical protein
MCSRLLVTRHTTGEGEGLRCRCGCGAWAVTRTTVLERLAFWFGLYRDRLEDPTLVKRSLGGTQECLEKELRDG